MIDNVFSNRTNVLILRFLSKFDNQFFTKEEIAQEINAGLRNVYDSLKYLTYEKIVTKKVDDKIYYRFVIDSKTKEIIHELFSEERNRLSLRILSLYKDLSEIEAKINKIAGINLVDIFLFGSIAKGRDTINSDIDLCVILNKHKKNIVNKIRSLSFEFRREIQIHIFTSKEFLQAKQNKNQLVMNILRDGISLRIGK